MTKILAFLLLLTLGSSARANEPGESSTPISYWNEIRPVFQVHCQGCHQGAKKGGEYVMTSYDAMMIGGESEERPIVPGDIENSYLFQQILPSQGKAEMPKGKPPLEVANVNLIRRWILEGAKNDSPKRDPQATERRSPEVYSTVPPITAIDVSADQSQLAVSGYHEVIVHDLIRFRNSAAGADSIVARLSGLSERIESIAFSPDGLRLAVAGGSPGRFGEIQIWNLESKELLFSKAAWHDSCFGVSWSPNGKLVAFGCPDNSAQVIEAETGNTLFNNRSHSDWVLGTAFSRSSKQLVSVSRDRTMKLLDISAKRFLTNLARFESNLSKIGIQAVAPHPSRDEYLIGGTDRIARIYSSKAKTGDEIKDNSNVVRKFAAVPGRIFDVRFSADGQVVIVAGDRNGRGFVHAFEAEKPKTGIPMQDIVGGIFTTAFLGNDGPIAAAGFDSVIYLHDVKTGAPLGTLDPFPKRR